MHTYEIYEHSERGCEAVKTGTRWKEKSLKQRGFIRVGYLQSTNYVAATEKYERLVAQGYRLDSDIECPNCGQLLELSIEERTAGNFTCASCTAHVEAKDVNLQQRSGTSSSSSMAQVEQTSSSHDINGPRQRTESARHTDADTSSAGLASSILWAFDKAILIAFVLAVVGVTAVVSEYIQGPGKTGPRIVPPPPEHILSDEQAERLRQEVEDAFGPAPGWYTLTAEDEGFSISFPEQPSHNTTSILTPYGSIDMQSWELFTENGGYAVSHYVMPRRLMLDYTESDRVDLVVMSIAEDYPSSQLESERRYVEQGIDGYYLRYTMEEHVSMDLLMAEDGDRFYQVRVVYPDVDGSREHRDRFINSFDLH